MKVSNSAVAALATQRALEGRIKYSEQDCQAFVKTVINDIAGQVIFKSPGSNDMYRNACDFCNPIKNSKKPADIMPGDLVFIVKQDNGEPAKYKNDGMGNADHVGIYCGLPNCEIAHSSATKGGVAPSTMKNAWNYFGRCIYEDYGEQAEIEADNNVEVDNTMPEQVEPQKPRPGEAMVDNTGTLRLRQYASTTAGVIAGMPAGAIITIRDRACKRDPGGNLWSFAQYTDAHNMRHIGYVMDKFLIFG